MVGMDLVAIDPKTGHVVGWSSHRVPREAADAFVALAMECGYVTRYVMPQLCTDTLERSSNSTRTSH